MKVIGEYYKRSDFLHLKNNQQEATIFIQAAFGVRMESGFIFDIAISYNISSANLSNGLKGFELTHFIKAEIINGDIDYEKIRMVVRNASEAAYNLLHELHAASVKKLHPHSFYFDDAKVGDGIHTEIVRMSA